MRTKAYNKKFEPFKETFPKGVVTMMPVNMTYNQWQKDYATIKREPIREQLKKYL